MARASERAASQRTNERTNGLAAPPEWSYSELAGGKGERRKAGEAKKSRFKEGCQELLIRGKKLSILAVTVSI
jgi:hypothetical protein